MNVLGVVAIGRNEGERLRRCLGSLVGRGPAVVYVDSGSTDGSVALARSMGVEVVELDMASPFTAARGRNAGFERLGAVAPGALCVMFLDGDCEVADGWLDRAVRELEEAPDVAVVCGRRRERFPGRSIYNRLVDAEWDPPVGEIDTCGGDALMRASAFAAVGGFDPTVPAGEEPELCRRLRRAGWKVRRVDADMTWHDSAMLRFGQWWRRQFRSGYGAQDVVARFGGGGDLFRKQIRGAWAWAAGWPLAVVAAGGLGAALGGPLGAAAGASAAAALLPLQMARLALKARGRVGDARTAVAYGVLTMVGKWAQLAGQLSFLGDHAAGRRARLIEYKAAGPPAAKAAAAGR